MTRDEAIDMVFDLISATRDLDRADHTNARYYRKEYEDVREKVIVALTSAYRKDSE